MEYYLATQEIIWEYITGGDVYWTNGKDGNVINIDTYKNDILTSINNYSLKPDIPSYVETYQDEYVWLEDKNNVLQYYSPNVWSAVVIGNMLELNTQFKGTTNITLTRNPLDYDVSYIYTSDSSQALATFGDSGTQSDSISISFKVKALSQITFIKKDKLYDKIIKNKETKVKIYDFLRNQYIVENGSEILTIGADGILETEIYLEEGVYIVEEVSAPTGYKKETNDFIFQIYEYNSSVTKVVLYSEPLLYDIYINSFGEKYISAEKTEQGYEGTYILESMNDAKYGVYASEDIIDIDGNTIYKKDDLVSEINILDGSGYAYSIPYGNYYLKELQCPDEYAINTNIIKLEFTDEDTFESFRFDKYLKKGNLIIKKVNNQIGLGGAQFNLYSSKYLQNIQLTSDSMGYIVLNNIPYDIYYLNETKAPDGYRLDNDQKIINLNTLELQYEFINEKELNIEPEETPAEGEQTDEPEDSLHDDEQTKNPEESPEKETQGDETEETPDEEESTLGPEKIPTEEETTSEPEEIPEYEEIISPPENNQNEIIIKPDLSEGKEQSKIDDEENDSNQEYIETIVENPQTFVRTQNNSFNMILYIYVLLGLYKLLLKS